ncbi:hypothetical protein EDB80DRAFT_682601 [Ilyonectria destructans]|nr:hypothetical protein EDB80DRAFT_682601 [Ilyonectria destructans]
MAKNVVLVHYASLIAGVAYLFDCGNACGAAWDKSDLSRYTVQLADTSPTAELPTKTLVSLKPGEVPSCPTSISAVKEILGLVSISLSRLCNDLLESGNACGGAVDKSGLSRADHRKSGIYSMWGSPELPTSISAVKEIASFDARGTTSNRH